MALWVCRAGKRGEHEVKFFEDNSIYCTWAEVDWDMSKHDNRDSLKAKIRETYPTAKEGKIKTSAGQLWTFSRKMQIGDLVATPSKIKPIIHIGKIISDYKYNPDDGLYRHSRSVKWLKDILKADIDQALRYSLGGALTIFSITRKTPDAEEKIVKLTEEPTSLTQSPTDFSDDNDTFDEVDEVDIGETALEEIADRLIAKYKGHGMANIVAAILEAKGYRTLVSSPGPDKGVDILASQGSLGFDAPRICVQVKSEENPCDRPTLDQLNGVMALHNADYGMLVSWSGFKSSAIQEKRKQFFKVRLWTHEDIVREFLHHYEDLPEEIRESIPLKRIWIIDKREI